MAQQAVAAGKEREGQSSISHTGRAPSSQSQGKGDRDMLAQNPTPALKCRWQWCCQTPHERKHQKCFMRRKRHCRKGLKPQMCINDPCRAELPRREVWGAMGGRFCGTKEFWDGDAEG